MISPLLANLYLHWFDKVFHRADGPAQWAKAKLVRYADDFVVLARYQGTRSDGLDRVEAGSLAGVGDQSGEDAGGEPEGEGASLDFLGFTFRYYADLKGRGWRYLNVSPSGKALKKEREKLRD